MPITRRVGIFWDVENGVPGHMSGEAVVGHIRKAASYLGNETLFNAYGDNNICGIKKCKALQLAGVNFVNTPHRKKTQVADISLVTDLMDFGYKGSAPVTVVLISGDQDFLRAVQKLQDRGNLVWLISPNAMSVSQKLINAVDGVISWETILATFTHTPRAASGQIPKCFLILIQVLRDIRASNAKHATQPRLISVAEILQNRKKDVFGSTCRNTFTQKTIEPAKEYMDAAQYAGIIYMSDPKNGFSDASRRVLLCPDYFDEPNESTDEGKGGVKIEGTEDEDEIIDLGLLKTEDDDDEHILLSLEAAEQEEDKDEAEEDLEGEANKDSTSQPLSGTLKELPYSFQILIQVLRKHRAASTALPNRSKLTRMLKKYHKHFRDVFAPYKGQREFFGAAKNAGIIYVLKKDKGARHKHSTNDTISLHPDFF